MTCFNPRARMGRDLNLPVLPAFLQCFNPRARMGRDDAYLRYMTSPRMFQSTRPHGARPSAFNLPIVAIVVSIHAPAWGATYHVINLFLFIICFNPRARMGRDAL